jgi:glycosyltransferase involved in cell wall biosynthesis
LLPVLSVLIPTYNRREIVARCLKSLAEQTLPPEQYEVIVIDDGSTDGTDEMLASLDYPASLRWKKIPHMGPSGARNRGLEMAKGEIVVFVDSDLIVVPEFLEAHLEAHRENPQKKLVVHGPVIHTTNLENPETKQKLTDFSRAFFATGNASVALAELKAAGMFDEEFDEYGWEDLEFGRRLKKRGLVAVRQPKAVGYHYKHKVKLAHFRALWQRERERGHMALVYYRKHPELEVKLSTMLAWPFFLLDRLLSLGGWPHWPAAQRFLRFLEEKKLEGLFKFFFYLALNHAYFDGMREAIRLQRSS